MILPGLLAFCALLDGDIKKTGYITSKLFILSKFKTPEIFVVGLAFTNFVILVSYLIFLKKKQIFYYIDFIDTKIKLLELFCE